MSAEEREGVAQAAEPRAGDERDHDSPAAEPAAPGPESAAARPDTTLAEPAPAAAPERGRPAVAGARDGLSAADLLALLAAVFSPGASVRHWTARLDAIGPLASGLPAALAGWTEGRAWSARAEVRWQQAGQGRYSALYLGEGERLPDGFAPLATGLRAVPGEDAAGLYLWGRRGPDGRYHATRLPHPLDYPAAAGALEARQPYQVLVGPDEVVRFLRLTLAEEG